MEESKRLNIADWYSSIIENSFDGIFIADAGANTVFVNRSYENITGLKKEEILHKNLRDLVKNKVISQSGTLTVLDTGEPVTMQQEFKTGKHALITSSPVYNKDRRIVLVVTNVRDMTEIYNLNIQLGRNEKQNDRLKKEIEHLKQEYMNYDIVAEDAQTLRALKLADKVRDMDTTVMLMGETGVGKEVFAQYIHRQSGRSEQPFIKVNCGAIPENLIESELFGYEKGAFTGADRNGKAGLFEVADKGTLFLDEIGELPLNMQVKLLRVLQEQEIKRVGGRTPINVDVRIIAATNRKLETMVEKGFFRKDLYYRLMVFPIRIPPLRERIKDIPAFAEKFLFRLNAKYGTKKHFSKEALEIMTGYPWPGNIRELKNVVERAYIVSSEEEISAAALGFFSGEPEQRTESPLPEAVSDLPGYIAELEQRYVREAYEKYGNVREAARSLGMSAATFTRKKNRQ